MINKSSHKILVRDVYCILGLPFDKVSLEQAVIHVNEAVELKNSSFISTPNLNFVISTQNDPSFFQSVVDSDLSLADGMPLIWVAKILGIPVRSRVAGSTLFEVLSKQSKKSKKIRAFFFGGKEGVAERASRQLNSVSTSMSSCGHYDPGFVSVEKMSSPQIIDTINLAEPDFIVVALGAKKGQEWIQRNRSQLIAPVISHLGAVINFVAGSVERAPEFWQKTGLEWLWRIRQEPGLWQRYLCDGASFLKLIFFNVFPLAVLDRCLKKTQFYSQQFDLTISDETSTLIVIRGSIKKVELYQVKKCFSEVLSTYRQGDVEIDCRQLSYIDSGFIASLLLFQQYLYEQERRTYLSHVPKVIKQLLVFNNVLKRFRFK